MRIGTRVLTAGTVAWLRDALVAGQLSRSRIARELCEREAWRNRRGELCAASARKALPRLAERLGLPLPPARRQPSRGPLAEAARVPQPQLEGSLQAAGTVRLIPVLDVEGRRVWRAMLLAEHPEGEARAPGKRLTYLIETQAAGVVGGLSFVAAPMRLGPRDEAIGWSPRAHGAHLEQVLSNDRFLILAGVRVPNLASHVLAKAARQVRADWRERHVVQPLLLETCVNARHVGTSYQAAGWREVGETAGRGQRGAPKKVWIRRLRKDWQRRLCEEPRRELGACLEIEVPPGASWAEHEFGRSDMPDERLRRRLVEVGEAWDRVPGQPLPAVFPGRAEQAGAYRFLENKRVTGADVLQPHREALVERCRREALVLLVQDTTTLNYSGLRDVTSGLGPLGRKSQRSAGLYVHAALAFTPGRRPLGVSGLESWARSREKRTAQRQKGLESQRWLRGFEQGAELGRVCPHTRVIVVGDRESDIYELFQRQARAQEQAGLLVRANAGRRRKVGVVEERDGVRRARREDLWAHMDTLEPLVRGRVVHVDSRGGKCPRPQRQAQTEVRMAAVQLQPPRKLRRAEPLQVWAVDVREEPDSAGEDPLRWLLLSSDGGPPSAENAERIVGWYESRWAVEEYFRALKSGTRIEDRRLRSREALEKCLAFDALAAWRTYDLCRAARETPEAPASRYLSAVEMLAIRAVSEEEGILPLSERGREPPGNIHWWVLRMAGLAGHHPSKRRPLPGHEKVWQAHHLVRPMVRGIEAILKALHRQQAAGLQGPHWPIVPTWPELQAVQPARWYAAEEFDSEGPAGRSEPT